VDQNSDATLLPVVAIGASAGGLEPIEEFFESVEPGLGCAYVIIQHLSPEFRSLMDQLLARRSSMPIRRITAGMDLQPNTIYLNLPRTRLALQHNFLSVEKLTKEELHYHPINDFFISLAEQRRSYAVAIVLSGTGNDGTEGSEAIARKNGIVLVQEPSTASFDGMPRSVLETGVQSLTARVPVLAEAVGLTLKEQPFAHLQHAEPLPIDDPLLHIFSLIKTRFGTDFSKYRTKTLQRRVERRALMNHVDSIGELRDIVRTDQQELAELYADLLIEVTSFFRDRDAFDFLADNVIPALVEQAIEKQSLRIWVAGCASGEEAYSIGMLVQEHLRVINVSLDVKIFATDIHERSMAHANSGVYSQALVKALPIELVHRYFDENGDDLRIKKSLRNTVYFSTHDVTRDPPFSSIDLVCCRNLLIYLVDEAQDNALRMFHFSLRVGGVLFLGASEHLRNLASEFDDLNSSHRIFKKRRDIQLLPMGAVVKEESFLDRIDQSMRNPSRVNSAEKSAALLAASDVQLARKRAFDNILAEYAPPGFLLDHEANVEHIFGNAGNLLPQQSGSFSRKIFDLIQPGLKSPIMTAINHMRNSDLANFNRDIAVTADDGAVQMFDLALTRLNSSSESASFMLLHIVDKKNSVTAEYTPLSGVAAATTLDDATQQHIHQLEKRLQTSEENLQSIIEELETSNEELQSSNEELMSTNEELQSTNEELHSVNEELYTVSLEHRRNNDELNRRNDDIKLLLKSSKISLIHLDENLCLKRYSPNAGKIFNLESRGIGHRLTDDSIVPANTEILESIHAVDSDRVSKTLTLSTVGRTYVVKISPNELDNDKPYSGIIISVIDTTELTELQNRLDSTTQLLELQNELNTTLEHYQNLVEGTSSIIVRYDAKTFEILYCNKAYAKRWNSTPEKLLGTNILSIRSAVEAEKFANSLKALELGENLTNMPTVLVEDEGKMVKHTALITTRGLSKDGVTVDQYQSIGVEFPENVQLQEDLIS